MRYLRYSLAPIALTVLSGCSYVKAAINDRPYGFLHGMYDGFWCAPKVAIEAVLVLLNYIGVPYGDLGPIIRTPNTGTTYFLGFTVCLILVVLGLAREVKDRTHRGRSPEPKGKLVPAKVSLEQAKPRAEQMNLNVDQAAKHIVIPATKQKILVDVIKSASHTAIPTASPIKEVKVSRTLRCPKCDSDNWRSLSFLYQAGITGLSSETSTTGGGVGIGTGGIGVGVGGSAGKTTGSLQSGLATQAAPPSKPSKMQAGVIYWGFVLLFLVMAGGNDHTVVAAILLGGAIYKWGDFKSRWKSQEAEDAKNYDTNRARWERSRMCQRCGEIYDPESAESSA